MALTLRPVEAHPETGSAEGVRVAVFTDTYAPQVNGVARTLARLTSEIEARGGAVRVFTTTDPEAAPAAEGDGVHRWPSLSFYAYPQLRVALPNWEAAARALARWQPTVVHVATPFGVGLAGRWAARRLGLPLVSSYHTSFSAYARFYGFGLLATPGWSFLRWFHNGGLRTFVPSEATRTELETQGFERVRLWSRGVDTVRFTPTRRCRATRARLGADDDALVVGYVGRVAREKGIDTILDAIPRVLAATARRVVFAFAGDGPYLDEARRRAGGRATFVGRLEGDDLAAFFASCDVFAFPSLTDTFGNVLLEAMASGVPIVAADAPPTLELLVAGGGTTYPGQDAAALADRLLALASDPARRDAHARAGLAYAQGRSWQAVFDGLVTEYREAAHEAGAGELPPRARRRLRLAR